VVSIEQFLKDDVSGLINSILDFAITSACTTFSVETDNKNLSTVLNDWLTDINSDLRGKIPTGLKALATEYFRERWKGSSFILLRSVWETKNGFRLPTKLWFVNGRDITITDKKDDIKRIGDESYELFITKEKSINLPYNKDEMVFVQKPFENWGVEYPTPYLIKRGVYHNGKLIEIMIKKGANVIAKALEYLFLMKKGSEELSKLNKPEFTYDEKDLRKAKDDFQLMIDEIRGKGGIPTYTTNWDTSFEHMIPDYKKALDGAIYSPAEKRILGGLGFIEVVEGITSTRRDAILNPKVFVSEVQEGVSGFAQLIHDVLMTIIQENKILHKKYVNSDMIQVRSAPLKSFYNDDAKTFLRGLYDRGLLSKRTLTDLCVDVDIDEEVERRKQEKTNGLEETMFPPIVQNIEKDVAPSDNIPPDKKPGSPEAKNYTSAKKKIQ
jgi:hypothetical protein